MFTSPPTSTWQPRKCQSLGLIGNLAVRFGDVCRKPKRLLALSRFLTHSAFDIGGDWRASLVPDASTTVDRDAVGPVEKAVAVTVPPELSFLIVPRETTARSKYVLRAPASLSMST